jgi:hypothetical protein
VEHVTCILFALLCWGAGIETRQWFRQHRVAVAALTGIMTTAVVALVVAGCCCPRSPAVGSGRRGPLPDSLAIAIPPVLAAESDTITEAAMQNVSLHVDDDIRLRIRNLRGQMRDLSGHRVAVLDDKNSLLIDIADAEIALTAADLTLLLNRYVFGYPKSPLRNLVVRTEGDHIVQTGIMHKIVNIPFEMTADLSVTPDGMILIRSTSMKICGIDGKGLLQAVDKTLADLLDLSGAKGVTVKGNDLLLDPIAIIPPPRIAGRLTAIRVAGNELVQTFHTAGARSGAALTPPVAAQNYVYFRGGTIRFGKLFMAATDLMAIDADESDPFDFYLDYYHMQLISGYHVTARNYGLIAYMPDFDDLGSAKGRVVR